MKRISNFLGIFGLIMIVSLVFTFNKVDAAVPLHSSEINEDYESLSTQTRYVSRYKSGWGPGGADNFVLPLTTWYSDNYGWGGLLSLVDYEHYGSGNNQEWIGYYSGYVSCYLEFCYHDAYTEEDIK